MTEEEMIEQEEQESAAPAEEIPAEHPEETEALRRELEALREENRRRENLEEAQRALAERGLDAGFAPFVRGGTPAEIRRCAEAFEKVFQTALQRRVSECLLQREPEDFETVCRVTRRRGIRRI